MLSFILAITTLAEAAAIRPAQLWQATLPDRIETVAISSGDCLAALTDSRLVVFDKKGARLWDAALPKAPDESVGGPLAIAPSCDWVAGKIGWYSPSVHIFRREGTRTSVPVNDADHPDVSRARWSGAESLSISPDSGLVAVGTVWKDSLLLIARNGAI